MQKYHTKNENDCPHRLTGWELAGLIQKRDAVISDSFLETSAQQQPKNCHQAIYTPVAQKVQDQAGWKARFKKIRSYKHGFKQFWSFTLAEENARIKIIIIKKVYLSLSEEYHVVWEAYGEQKAVHH